MLHNYIDSYSAKSLFSISAIFFLIVKLFFISKYVIAEDAMMCRAVNVVRVAVNGLVIFLINWNTTLGPSIKPGTLYVQYRLAN